MVYYKDKWGGILGLRDIKRKGKEGREQERRENLYQEVEGEIVTGESGE